MMRYRIDYSIDYGCTVLEKALTLSSPNQISTLKAKELVSRQLMHQHRFARGINILGLQQVSPATESGVEVC